MKHLLLFLALLLAGASATAQVSHSAARPDSLTVPLATAPAAPDTVAALHRLFKSRRHRRNFLAAGLSTGLLVGTVGLSLDDASGTTSFRNIMDLDSAPGHPGSSTGTGQATATSGWLWCVVPAGPLLVLDYLLYARYSRKKEARAVADWQAHRLPTHLRRQLKPRYFQ